MKKELITKEEALTYLDQGKKITSEFLYRVTNSLNWTGGGGGTPPDLSGYQEKLISGTNIVTINDQSLLNKGNLTISGTILFDDVIPGEYYGIAGAETIPVTGVTISPPSFVLNTGATRTLTAIITPADATYKTVVWETSDPSIATVSKGVVTGVAEGVAIITATSIDGSNIKGTTTVTVEKVDVSVIPVVSVSISKSLLTLEIDAKETLTATVLPTDATNKTLEWVSSNPAIATVVNGEITALSGGKCTITVSATDGSGKSAVCNLTVNAAEMGLLGHYDLTQYEDGYTGPIEDISGFSTIPLKLYETPEDLVHARHRAGFIGGKLMVNSFYNPKGQGIYTGSTRPYINLPENLNPYDKIIVGLYIHLRREYDYTKADGIITPVLGSFSSHQGPIVQALQSNGPQQCLLIPTSLTLNGPAGVPSITQILDPEIHIDHFNGETTITDKYIAIVVGFSGIKYSAYVNGQLVAETVGRANLNFSNQKIDILRTALVGDIKCIKIWNKDLTPEIAMKFYQDMLELDK